LVKRLEAGAAHYRKLAAEKNAWEKTKLVEPSTIAEQYMAKIGSLEKNIVELSSELRQARLEQDLQLSRISRAVSQNSSITIQRDDYSIVSSISGESNMGSIKINNAVTTSQEAPAVKMPSLFHPFQPKPENTNMTVQDPSLPAPIIPENIDPTVLIPELQPREPASYSSAPEAVTPTSAKVAQLECPMCEETFAAGCTDLLEHHVEQHLENAVECPICGKSYDKKNQAVYEEHVQGHFAEQSESLEIRGWDLGID